MADEPIIITPEVEKQIEDHLRLYGNAFIRRNPDGTVECLDPTGIIHISNERLVSRWGEGIMKALDEMKKKGSSDEQG